MPLEFQEIESPMTVQPSIASSQPIPPVFTLPPLLPRHMANDRSANKRPPPPESEVPQHKPYASSHLPEPVDDRQAVWDKQATDELHWLPSQETIRKAARATLGDVSKEVPGAVLINLARCNRLPAKDLLFLWHCDSLDAMARAEVPEGFSKPYVIDGLIRVSLRLYTLGQKPLDRRPKFVADGIPHGVTPAEYIAAAQQAAVLCLFHFGEHLRGSEAKVAELLPLGWPPEFGEDLRRSCVDAWNPRDFNDRDRVIRDIVMKRYGKPAQRPDAGLRHFPT